MNEDGGLIGIWKASTVLEAQQILAKYQNIEILKTDVKQEPESIFTKFLNTKNNQLDMLNLFNDEYYSGLWKELSQLLTEAVRSNRFVGISIFP